MQRSAGVKLIDRDELKAKIERGDEFKLVMVLNEWAFNAKHIPGSVNVTSAEDAAALLEKDDEIVIYCSDSRCIASKVAFDQLSEAGYTNVRRYAGGIAEWEDHGLPMEGNWA